MTLSSACVEKPIHDSAIAAGAERLFLKPDTLTELVEIARSIVEIGLQ